MNRCAALALALLALAVAEPAAAVPPQAVSGTAQATCEFRAIAAQHPDARLRNADRLAGRLCGPRLLPREYEAARDVIESDPEGFAGYFYVNARTRYIDRQLERFARGGVAQVVILGAG
ncbi:MAG TPA: class I SAM-dependent methyltransferase, partial [Burkholderiales bacterium]|nr:class I SAM-dependent methyltransferase [Burkholderiales bacterium]